MLGIPISIKDLINVANELFGNTVQSVYDEFVYTHTITSGEVSAKTDLTNAYLLSLTHRGSAGDPVGGVTSIAPSGFSNDTTDTTFIFTQGSASNTWTINHNLGTQYPNVTVFDSNDVMIIPTTVTANGGTLMTLTFSSPVAGVAV